MFAILSSQLAFSAASTLAKKSFEFGITSSLRGLSDVIKDRFQHSKALQETQGELELKVKMLCLPVDILAHHVTQGNTALQEPLGVALGVLDEVEAFRQALVAQDVARAQDASSPDGSAANAAQLCKRLKELVARLDSVLPYLNLAISTVALLNQGPAAPLSPSRLMAASWRLRSNPHPGAAVFSLPEASWHEERQLTAAGPAMAEAFRLCSLTVCRSQLPASGGHGPDSGGDEDPDASQGGLYFGGYELLLHQDLNDGLYHDPEESAASLRLQVCDIVGLEWETTRSLNQGENEYRPALVLHVLHSSGSSSDEEADQRQQGPAVAAAPGTAGRDRRAALQAAAASPLPTPPRQQGGAVLGSSLLQREWQLLGELEYVLRLCILESREQLPHHEVTDERIQMAFQATSAHSAAAALGGSSTALAGPSFHAGPAAAAAAAALDAGGSARQRDGSAVAAARWRSAAAEAAAAVREGVREGVEAVTLGVRQLSFTPGGSAVAPPGEGGASEAGGAAAGRTRGSSRAGGRGFGSPVQ
ncbi:1 domain-containing [Chlorella sorokiniana]|uniref:1 domain-containing n=1 Tax=Chlorella sorokiniana TaxID=3076 RepID=A0A2P6TKH8_CHLSO|nr:1 domain-containing [Chlorella sorokiniana]|eukprot:PRW44576.1 1 domain-containing [Chlorella sorokiniana]